MSIIVDTPIWSSALRRTRTVESTEAIELAALIRGGRAILLGPIRQELLSGVRSSEQFNKLKRALRAFPDFRLRLSDYEEAAACHNTCRSRGIQGSSTDFIVCAAAKERGLAIYTTDKDFERYARVLAIKLHQPTTTA